MISFLKNTFRFFSIIVTSFLCTILIIIIIAISTSVIGIVTVLDSLENISYVSIPEREKENSSYIYSINESTGEYDLIYKVTPYTGNVQIDISLDDLPEYVIQAFVCAEDERFYSHEGVDIRTTTLAVIKEVLRCSGLFITDRTGGSTITQQLIKNITADNEVTASRKIREIFRAVNLEKNYSKDEIIEKYLNIVYFGQTTDGYNMYGVEAASIGYFGKSANELSIAQAASLAATLVLPNSKNPVSDNQANSERTAYCLRKMFEQGVISPYQYENAIKEKIKTVNPKTDNPTKKLSDYPNDFKNPEPTTWVIDAALSEFCDYLCESQNISRNEAMERFMSGGYELYLTVDNTIQKHLEEKYSDYTYFPEDTAEYANENGELVYENVQSAIVVMDYKGKIKGIVGRIGEKNSSFCWNNALDARRQPGSSIKPLTVYSYGIETGQLTWSSFFSDSPLPPGTASEYEWPYNYGGTYSGQPVTVIEAITESYNTVPAQICNTLNIEDIFNFTVNKMKLQLNKKQDISYSALCVGATYTGPTLVSLANSYIPFGNGGMYYKAHIINRIKDSGSQRVYVEKDASGGIRSISEETAYIINKMLRNVITNGTGKRAILSNKQNTGKTGTSEHYRDLTFIGLTEDFVSAIWIGYENGNNSYALSQTNSPQVWKNVFGDFADGYISDNVFPQCDTVVYADYCEQSGLLASKNCKSGGKGYYKSDNLQYCKEKHVFDKAILSPSE